MGVDGLGYDMGHGVCVYGLGVHSLSHGGAWVALDVSIGYWSCLRCLEELQERYTLAVGW